MENNKNVLTSTEPQKEPQVLKIGQTFELPLNKVILLGRADTVVGESYVYRIDGLKSNLVVSNFALGMIFTGGYHKTVFKPDFNLNGTPYKSSNKVIIDTRDEQIEVDDKYSSEEGKGGTVIDKVIVGDENMENGFILEAAGGDRMKLSAVISGGKNL